MHTRLKSQPPKLRSHGLKITNELIDKIAVLARLNIKDSEKPRFSEQLTEILQHMKVLDEIKAKADPMFHACVEERELRADEVIPFNAEAIMKNAHDIQNGYFVVPNIISGEDE